MRKKITYILFTVAFIIWLFIFYQWILKDDLIEPKKTTSIKSEKQLNQVDTAEVQKYPQARQRDPFGTPYNSQKSKKKNNKKATIKKELKPPPALNLIGVLNNQNRTIALIKLPDQSIRFVEEKQKIGEIQIIAIDHNSLKYKFENRVLQLVLK